MKDPRRHIAIVARVITGSTGTSRTILDHAKYLVDEGYRITLMGEKLAADKIAQTGAEVCQLIPFRLGSKTKRLAFSWQVDLQRKLRGLDVVWGHGDNLNQDFLSLHNCVQLAHETLHGVALPEDSGVGLMHRRILSERRFGKIIANSKLMAADLTSRYGIDPSTIGIIYPGYNPRQFNTQYRIANSAAIRRSLGIAPDTLVLGLITSGDFQKRGVEEFVTAIGLLTGEMKRKLQALIIGKDHRSKKIVQLAEELGIAEQVRILPPTDQIERFYQALDLLVHPAKIEEFGQVVQEAIMCGTPVLVGAGVGASELFQGPGRKLVLGGVEPQEIAQAIAGALADRTLTRKAHEAVFDLMRFNTDYANFEKTKSFLGL